MIDTDSGPALTLHDCSNIETSRLRTNTPHDGSPLLETDVAKSQ